MTPIHQHLPSVLVLVGLLALAPGAKACVIDVGVANWWVERHGAVQKVRLEGVVLDARSEAERRLGFALGSTMSVSMAGPAPCAALTTSGSTLTTRFRAGLGDRARAALR